MKNVKKLKYISIVILCAILDMSLHVVTSKISPISKEGNFSILAKTIGLPAAAMLWIIIAFASVAYVYNRYEDKLPGSKIIKGLRYGGAIGLLWFWGMIESISITGTTIIHETVIGICDSIPVLVMGLLLGKLCTGSNSTGQKNKSFNKRKVFLSVFIFSSLYLVGRYIFYITKIIESGYEVRPYATFIWTLGMGILTGIIYLLLGQAAESSSKLLSAIKFGVIIFGINWFIFLIFLPFLYAGTFIDIIIRSMVDIVIVILGYYISDAAKGYL